MTETLDFRRFGQRLREVRTRHGLSQQALGERVGGAASWISDLEQGKQTGLAANTVYRLCKALEVSADYLLGLSAKEPWSRQPATNRPRPRKTEPVGEEQS